MNISRNEQRALHILALGGLILHECDAGRKVTLVFRLTREGTVLTEVDLSGFRHLRRHKRIESRQGQTSRTSERGRLAVRVQADNRGGGANGGRPC